MISVPASLTGRGLLLIPVQDLRQHVSVTFLANTVKDANKLAARNDRNFKFTARDSTIREEA
jgi:hypothetical protein